jgi:hypothetical protein
MADSKVSYTQPDPAAAPPTTAKGPAARETKKK